MVIYQDSRDVYWFGSWKQGCTDTTASRWSIYNRTRFAPDSRIDEFKEDESGNMYFASFCSKIQTIVRLTEIHYNIVAGHR